MFIISELEAAFSTVIAGFLLQILMFLHVSQVAGGAAAVVTLVIVQAVGLETMWTLELVSPVMMQLEMFHNLVMM